MSTLDACRSDVHPEGLEDDGRGKVSGSENDATSSKPGKNSTRVNAIWDETRSDNVLGSGTEGIPTKNSDRNR